MTHRSSHITVRHDECEALVATTVEHFGALHVLHNNAGVAWPGRDGFAPDVDVETWDRVIAINLSGTFYCCHYAIPRIAEATADDHKVLGHLLLKAAEGLADMLMKTVSAEILGVLNTEKSLATQAFHSLAKRFEYHEIGGAPLLGVQGISIICHGASNARSIQNALRFATTLKARGLNEQIVDALAKEPSTSMN